MGKAGDAKSLRLRRAFGFEYQPFGVSTESMMAMIDVRTSCHVVETNTFENKYGIFTELIELFVLFLIQVIFATIPNLIVTGNQRLRCVNQVVQLSILVAFRDQRCQITCIFSRMFDNRCGPILASSFASFFPSVVVAGASAGAGSFSDR